MSDAVQTYRPLSAEVIAIRYALFAVLAGALNLLSQAAIVRVFPHWPLMISVLVGTGTGFIVKYLLDNRWIFQDEFRSHSDELRKIVIYGVSGVATTALFWAIELSAWALTHSDLIKYVGASVGLCIGNWVKYRLDKHYVFRPDR